MPPIAWLPSRRRHVPGDAPDAAALERGLAALGLDVTILDPLPWPWNPLHGRHPLLRGIDPLRALRVLLFHRRADLVLCVFEGPALVPALLRGMLGFRPRLVMWDLGLAEGWWLRRRMLDLLMPRLDAILVLGSNQPAAIAARWDRHPAVWCVGHYIDTEFWRPLPMPMPVPVPGPGPEPGPPLEAAERYVLAVGDDGGRDYPRLLAVAAALDCICVIRSGQALPLDARRHRHVRHLRARMPFVALRALYAGACVVVVPLHDLPTAGGVSAVLEAAAMGCAMVVSDSVGVRDWLSDGLTCLVVPCGDTPAMAAAVRRLLGDAALRQRLGAAARAWAEQVCSPAAFTRRLADQLAAPGDARA